MCMCVCEGAGLLILEPPRELRGGELYVVRKARLQRYRAYICAVGG